MPPAGSTRLRRKRVHHERRLFSIGRLDQSTADFQIGRMARVIPVGEVGDKLEHGLAQVFVLWPDFADEARKKIPCLLLEIFGAVLVARVRQEQLQ